MDVLIISHCPPSSIPLSAHTCEIPHPFQSLVYPILASLVGLVNDIRVHNAYSTYRTKSYTSDVLLGDRSGLQYVVNVIYYLIVGSSLRTNQSPLPRPQVRFLTSTNQNCR